MTIIKPIAAASVALMLLVGCGQSEPLPLAPKPSRQKLQERPPQMTPMAPGVGPMGPTGQAPGMMVGTAILSAMRQKLTTIRGFDATITSYTQGNYKGGEKVSELRKSTTSARLIWVKPEKVRAETITATNPLLEGAALVTTNGRDITVRAKGLLGLIPFKLTASDAKLSSNRNHSFTENNPKSHLERLTGGAAIWNVIGEQTVEGVPCKLVRIDSVERLDREITHEVVAIDPRTLALRKLTMYAGNTKVVDHTFNKFRWDPTVSGDTFSL